MWRPKPDPRVKRTDKCVVCGKIRPPISISHGDPFCSAACARYYHKVDLISEVKKETKKSESDKHDKKIDKAGKNPPLAN